MKRFVVPAITFAALSGCSTYNPSDACSMADREITHASLLENSMNQAYELCLADVRRSISEKMVE